MNVLFLDIDGVCNHEEFYKRRRTDPTLMNLPYPLSEFDPLVVNRINEILDITGAKLVISSDWRFQENLQTIFDNVGFTHKIYDITPYGMGKSRGDEIDMYINTHDVDKYVIIDDIYDFYKYQKPYVVSTNNNTGLTEELKNKAVNILISNF